MKWLRRDKNRIEDECCEERLSAYLDCELTAEERAAVERHLAQCEGCRWNLETLRQTVDLTRNCAPVRLPRSFTIPVEAAAPQAVRARRPAWGLPLLQGATALVALLFVVVVAGDLFTGGLAPRSEPQMAAFQTSVVVDEVQVVKEVAVTQVVEMAMPTAMAATESAVEEPPSEPAAAKAAPTEPPAHLLIAPEEPAVAAIAPTATSETDGVGGGEAEVSATEEVLEVMVEPSPGAAGAAAMSAASVTLEIAAAMPMLTQPLTVQVTLTEWMTAEEMLTPTVTAVPAVLPAAAAAPTRSLAPMPTTVQATDRQAVEPAPIDAVEGQAGQEVTNASGAGEAYDVATPAEAPVALLPGPEATAVAAAPEGYGVEQSGRTGEEREAEGTAGSSLILLEVGLGAVFVLLALTTVVVMVRQRAR